MRGMRVLGGVIMKFSFEVEEILYGVLKILKFRCFVYVFLFRWGIWGGMKRN